MKQLALALGPPPPALYDYQREGIRFLAGRSHALCADEPGLGKSAQAIGVINADVFDGRWQRGLLEDGWTVERGSTEAFAAYAGVPNRAMPYRVLIVAPKSLTPNWRAELDLWLSLEAREAEACGALTIAIVSYEGLAKWEPHPLDLLIVDEAHYIKNDTAKRTQRLLALRPCARRILLLTGTPIQNRPKELWTLLRILDPEAWDPAGVAFVRAPGAKKSARARVEAGGNAGFWPFVRRYCDAKRVQHGKKPTDTHWDLNGASNLEELHERLTSTVMIRRRQADVLSELPALRRRLVLLPSPKGFVEPPIKGLEHEGYDAAVSRLRGDKVAFAEYSTQRAEQGIAKVPAALAYLIDALEAEGKILVFGHHGVVLDALQEGLTEHVRSRGAPPVTGGSPRFSAMLTGRSSLDERAEAVRRFQTDPECRVFLGSIGAAGVGLTLTAADRVMFVELDPVPGRMSQAEKRAHRIGQSKSVLVEHLVWDRSLDARLCRLLIAKQAVLDMALDGGGP